MRYVIGLFIAITLWFRYTWFPVHKEVGQK